MADTTYTTFQGQTWDQVAYELYGNEYLCDKLMDANRHKLNYFVFPSGIILRIPDKDVATIKSVSSDFPAWRAMLNG